MTDSYKHMDINKKIYILCATSGDTGKAALEGFKNINNTFITVFYPNNAVSKIQKLQMVTTDGNNTNVVSVDANFDECQKIVKKCMSIKNELLNNTNVIFSSANSINIGRLIPQVVYYFKSYFDLINKKQIDHNTKVNYIVPTGNFGDILAGYLAKKIGLPVNKLVCATNINDVLCEFLKTGVYNINRSFYETISPSMDILVSSNLERLLFIESDFDDKYIDHIMNELNNNKYYKIDSVLLKRIQDTFLSYSCNNDNIMKTINCCFRQYNKLIDTHTACAIYAMNNLKSELGNYKNIVLSTASALKFPKAVYNSISNETYSDEFEYIDRLYSISNESVPINLLKLKSNQILHNDNIDKDLGINYVKNKIDILNNK